jgi:hypothetical protein
VPQLLSPAPPRLDGANLVRSVFPPEDPTTLMVRTVLFLFLFRDVCEAIPGEGLSFDMWLSALSADAGALWVWLEQKANELRADPIDLDER